MICLKGNKALTLVVLGIFCLSSCGSILPVIPPALISDSTPHDTDDPAIWINKDHPERSIVFGTDKDEINGGVYAFDLDGKIIKDKSLTGLSYPNNVDIGYNFKLNDSLSTDIMVFTEREKHQIRLFSVPDMKQLDNGGLKVFEDESDSTMQRPMGIALYRNDFSDKTYAIVSRKEGPVNGYLYQYLLESDSLGVRAKLVRKFGEFSGKKEIEAIAVDQELGYIYYADENHCIRKYYANPENGDKELACFGGQHFKRDIEGIAIARFDDKSGYIIVSNQQAHNFSIFDRTTNNFIKQINLGTKETDGCEVTTAVLGNQFPNGLFVSMTDSKTFVFHDLGSLNLSAD
ncbi:phytase [Winogradskyella aurantia]|uniref:3-phytase n=1 Tax=Winogradskyella aurantia TaxID=1915063 RepID=A0A265UZA5_9FLAO|nr:phytase [Winogradskyella aurantia]OZV70626.1 3-phytase [Winogradskyella aurantia]